MKRLQVEKEHRAKDALPVVVHSVDGGAAEVDVGPVPDRMAKVEKERLMALPFRCSMHLTLRAAPKSEGENETRDDSESGE